MIARRRRLPAVPPRTRPVPLAAVLRAAVACSALYAAVASGHEGHAPLPSKGVVADGARGTIALAPATHAALGVETAEAEMQEHRPRTLAYARFEPAWNRHAFAASGIDGRVAAIHVRAGDVVRAGQRLATIESLALETIQLELLTARVEQTLAARTFERMRALTAAQAIAVREQSEARARLEQTRGAVDVAMMKLRGLDVPDDVVAALLRDADRPLVRSVDILSPIAGTVVHVDVTAGDVVTADDHLFEVVDLAEVAARISVLEHDLHAVAVGQEVELTVPAWPDEAIVATIHTTGMTLDPTTRLGSAWAAVANGDDRPLRFLPGMTGQARIVTASGAQRVAVPAEALVGNGIDKFVLVEEAATARGHEYRKQNVVVAAVAGGRVLLGDGSVFPGDRVVTKGSHQLGTFFVGTVLNPGPEAIANMGLRVERATVAVVDEVLEFDAAVDVPPGSRSVAAAQVAGRIARLRCRPGQVVAAGEVLAEVTSLDALDLQLQLIQAASQRRLADENLERLRTLADTQSVPGRRVWEQQTAALALAERVETLGRQLRGIGFAAAEIERVAGSGAVLPALAIRSPGNGTVVRADAVVGQVIRPDQPIAEIHDPRHAWIRGHLTEREVGRLHAAGDPSGPVRVRFTSLPERVFTGRVVRRGNVIDADDRTVPLWVELDVPSGMVLQHGMLARVTLPVTRRAPALAVPRSAIVHQGTRAYLFVRRFTGTYQRRAVSLGAADDRLVTVTSGLKPGEMVAVAGAADLQTAFASIR